MGSAEAVVSVLAVSPAEEDHVLLEHVFSHSNWRFSSARTCEEAVQAIEREDIPVIICAVRLPDGTWQDLLSRVGRRDIPPRLIVASQVADDSLWAEVLDLGGYDVLGKPFDAREVIRVVSLAWRQWKYDCERRLKTSERQALRHNGGNHGVARNG